MTIINIFCSICAALVPLPMRVAQFFFGDTAFLIFRPHNVDEIHFQPLTPGVGMWSRPGQSSCSTYLASATDSRWACDLSQVGPFVDVHGGRKILLTLVLISCKPEGTGKPYRKVLLKDGHGEKCMCTHTHAHTTPLSTSDDFEFLNLGKSEMLSWLDFAVIRSIKF